MILHLTITEHVCEAGAAVQVTEEIGFEVEHFQIDIHLIKNASLALLGTGFASDTRTLRMRDSRNSQFFPRLRRGNTGRGGAIEKAIFPYWRLLSNLLSFQILRNRFECQQPFAQSYSRETWCLGVKVIYLIK